MSLKKKVLIVDDSSFMRKILSDVISNGNWVEVIDVARNGIEALEKVKIHKPDIITLDVQMPLMDGITCLKSIMKEFPTPVLIVSSLTKEGADITINALEEGAVDFIAKPENIFSLKEDLFSKELIQKLKIVSSTRKSPGFNINRPNLISQSIEIKDKPIVKDSKINNGDSMLKYLVAIGTSTGGPRALQEVLTALPANLPAAIPIVQHMPPGFTKSLAARLDSLCNINVKEAEDGDILKMGWAYIAPGDSHIRIVKKNYQSSELKIMLTKEPPVGGHRPSANILFSSISEIGIKNAVGVIMTGMGNDGCEGLKQMHSINNAPIIAQNEESCVVYGMPKSVVQAGIASKVVHLSDIAKEITKIVGV
jgi:two-component system chemotaxis response regulator CheB